MIEHGPTTEEHEFRTLDGGRIGLTPRQLRKLRGFATTHPTRELRLLATTADGTAVVSVLAGFVDGHVTGARTALVRPDGQMRWR